MSRLKQLFKNNWSTSIASASVGPSATAIEIPLVDSAALGAIGANEFFVATASDGANLEIMWITGNDTVGNLTVVRAQEGTTGLTLGAGHLLEIRNTAGAYTGFVQRGAPREMLPKTANYNVTTADFGKVIPFSHASTTGTMTLPSVGATEDGAVVSFVKSGAARLIIASSDTDVIHDSSGPGTIYSDSTYATISLMYVDAITAWVIVHAVGTWTTT